MFSDAIANEIVKAANQNGVEPAALLAIVEVETGGKPFENDGRTPTLLYERHVAWREAGKRGQLAAFKKAGLAIPRWNRAVQYQDQRTSAQRIALIERARRIDPEIACRSASWGIGQTMGFNAEMLGYPNATRMVEALIGNLAAQLDCLLRELKKSDLVKSLNAHEWVRVARLYNGAGYAANRYDTKLADAYRRWSRKIDQLGRPTPPEQKLAPDEIRNIQRRLRNLGYHEVGRIDGIWGPRTVAALSAFQHHEGLPVSGHFDAATHQALLMVMVRRPVSIERQAATINDLRRAGSETIKQADNLAKLAAAKITAGTSVVTASVSHPNWTIIACGVTLIAAGLVALWIASKIKSNRLADHSSGEHAGSRLWTR